MRQQEVFPNQSVDQTQLPNIQTLDMIGVAVTATATAGFVTTGAVHRIYIDNMGNGYVYAPTVGIGSAPDGGTTAVGVVSLTDYWINADGIIIPLAPNSISIMQSLSDAVILLLSFFGILKSFR